MSTEKLIEFNDAQRMIQRLRVETAKRVFGMDRAFSIIMTALLAKGHCVLEDVPGTAKTLLVKTIAEGIACESSRTQGTPDVRADDITGQEVLDPVTGKLVFRRGPIFTDLYLTDEINRFMPKSQSALLEAMAERQVSLSVSVEVDVDEDKDKDKDKDKDTQEVDEDKQSREHTVNLPELFTVIATQNPIEDVGTYPLTKAQADRFMFKDRVGYPSREDELKIAQMAVELTPIESVMSREDIFDIRRLVWEKVHVSDEVLGHMVDLTRFTRPEEFELAKEKLILGCSPRVSQTLFRASKAWAFLEGREHVMPEDVAELAPAVLRHRVEFRNYKKDEHEQELKELLDGIYKEIGLRREE
ncbi:MAG: AAA family ATPase [Candidatus Spechtbacterales bacterium]